MADPKDMLKGEPLESSEGELVEINDDNSVEDTEDGGAIIRFDNEEQSAEASEHFANLAGHFSQSLLSPISDELLEKIERDKEARKKRDKIYEEGLRRTGLGDDAPGGAQFSGANRVVHPMLVEACVDFSARAMKELAPPGGPVKSKILGKPTQAKTDKANRKVEYLNWQTTEQMPEFRGELEQLTTQLPLGGAQYLKLSWSPSRRRPTAEFVAIDDILLPYAATNFYSAERRTHVQYITKAEYQKRVMSGMYIDVDLPSPDEPELTLAGAANNKIEGRESTSYNEDGLRTIFEISTTLDVGEEEGEAPYLITIDKSSQRVLGLYRNWNPGDGGKLELDWIVEFPFIPWRGAYPIGLTHLIGGLSAASTGALRALLDSAHIQNIPTLLKLKGGASGQTLNVAPTQVTEVEGGAVSDDIRKLIMAMPFAGPSPTLFQLLGFLTEAGRGVVQTSFEKLSDTNANQPVGTTLALIEQGMVVFSSIHSRLHNAMSRVFKILHRINASYLTDEDIKKQGSGIEVRPQDFDDPMDVVPVSDPAIFSEAQRFAQVTAVQQRAAAVPQLYDARKVEEMFLRAMKVDQSILVPVPGKDNIDPASENVAAAMGQPVFVLPKQDHVAHLKVHMAFMQSPLFGRNPLIAKTYALPMIQHLRDHLLNLYLTQSHDAVTQAVEGQIIQDEASEQVKIIALVQRMLENDFSNLPTILAQEEQFAQQFIQQPPMPPDSSLQVAQIGAQVQGQKMQLQAQTEQQKLAQKAQNDQAKLMLDQQKVQVDAQESQQAAALKQQEIQAENLRNQLANATRERMNTADNQTAMQIAAAEMATGELVSLSTGTGINP